MAGNRLVFRLIALAVVAGGIAYIVHLQSELNRAQEKPVSAAVVPTAPAAPAAAPAAAAGQARTIDASQREAMITALGGRGSSLANPVWFATVPNNSEAAAFQKLLQGIFEEAGWIVKGNAQVGFNMKPGVYIFAADEEPPNYVNDAQEGLEAAGIEVVASGRGYRDYYKAKKEENPSFVGFPMAEDQTYVIVIGRKPEPTPAAQP
jgi:hypothetical protein